MGRVLVLSLLLGVMWGLRTLSGDSDGAHDPLILAAIGFVVMASYTAAELGFMLSLPRVSGYIAAGLLLGPSAGNILTERVVQDMTMFNTLALGLIATGAGLELDIKALKVLLRTLLATVGAKIVLAGGLVFAAFAAIEMTWQPLGLPSTEAIVASGMVLATLAVGTSPAITLAVINETGARGRLADLTLGASVLKDLVLVVLLAVSIAVGTGLLGVTSGHGSLVGTLTKELGGSVAVGAVLGGLIIAYVRFVGAEMLLFVAGLVLASAEVSRMLHLDLLLVFIAAGFVVRNFSKVWEEVLHALETVALPVFVVFFTIAGARIDLEATVALLPVALALSAVRAGAFFAAARVGARVGGESELVRKLAWQAYLPQAGVTLGLLGLAVEALGSAVGQPLMDVGVACVAVNLAIGPVMQRRALQQSLATGDDTGTDAAGDSLPAPASEHPSARPERAAIETGDAAIDGQLRVLHDSLDDVVRQVCHDTLRAQATAMTSALSLVLDGSDRPTQLQRLLAWARSGQGERACQRASEQAAVTQAALLAPIMKLPLRVRTALSATALGDIDGDTFAIRLRRRSARIRSSLGRGPLLRQVPLRSAAQLALLPRTYALAGQVQTLLCRQQALVLGELRALVDDEKALTDVVDAITGHLAHAEHAFRSDAAVAFHSGFTELSRLVTEVDGPTLPLSKLRYSDAEPEVRERAEQLQARTEAWRSALDGEAQGLLAAASLARLQQGAEAVLEKVVLMPLAEAAESVEPAVASMRGQLGEAIAWIRDPGRDVTGLASLRQTLHRTAAQTEQSEGSAADQFRAAAALHTVSVELRASIDALPAQVTLLAGTAPLASLHDPAQASLRSVDLVARAQEELAQEFVRALDVESRRAASAVQELQARVQDAIEMTDSVFEAIDEGGSGGADGADDALGLALQNLEQGTAEARAQLIAAHDAIAEAFEAALARLHARIRTGGTDLGVARQAFRRPLLQAWTQLRARAERLRNRIANAREWLLGTDIAQRLATPPSTPQEVRALLSRSTERDVPASYRRLFKIEADQDMRHSVGRDAVLQRIVEAQAGWAEGGAGSVLLVGDAGAGRTTLMNAVQVEITAQRLLRPEAQRSRRKEGLLRALAYELRCATKRREVMEHLRAQPTAVLVDDLEQWLPVGAEGPAALRGLLSLMRQTRREVFWIVSCGSGFAGLIRDAEPIDQSFGHVLTLQPLSLAQLRRAIDLRHSLSGMTLVFPQVLGKLPSRLMRDSDSELVFRLLHSMSGGNPSGAFSLWLNSVRVDGQRVHVLLEQLLKQQLHFGHAFDPLTTAVMVQLHRYGPMGTADLAGALGVEVPRLHAPVVALRNANLLADGSSQLRLAVPFRALLGARLPMRGRWRN